MSEEDLGGHGSGHPRDQIDSQPTSVHSVAPKSRSYPKVEVPPQCAVPGEPLRRRSEGLCTDAFTVLLEVRLRCVQLLGDVRRQVTLAGGVQICELDQRSRRERFRLCIIPSPQPVKLRWGRSQPWPQLRGRIFSPFQPQNASTPSLVQH